MRVSIITVCLNSGKTIKHTLESVKNQSYKNIEYILVDGLSTDNTLDIIREFSDVITILISEKDSGLYDAMNKGLSIFTGDIVGILNSDDIFFDDDVLKDIVRIFEENPSAQLIYGNIVYISSGDSMKEVRNWISLPYYTNFFEDGNVPPHPSLFIRKDIAKKIGLFNIHFKFASDYEYMLRAMKVLNFKSLYVDRYIVKMKLGGQTNKSLKNIIKGNKEIISAWKINGFKYPSFLMIKRLLRRLAQFFI